ncbi:MAG: UDP-N-acetylglucosamine 2-epimerase, partial [Gammaproteobacteria bacterium]|nr:UDP-N-acetylglucosamine 2-epimerase [Gammaproteobacteria bacterium]
NLNDIFFENFGIRKPDYFLGVSGDNLGHTIGNIIANSYDLLRDIKPDALLVLGDTNSVLCTISAKRLKIPIFHMESGNRCFDQNVPEEINRKISDHISDINITYTEHSRRYLLSEGFRKDHVFVSGPPLTEVLEKNKYNISKSNVLHSLNIEKDKFFVTSKSECKRMYRIIFNDMMTTLDEDGFMLRHVVNDKNITPDEEIIAIKEAYVETLEELHSSEQSRFPVKVIVRITPSLDGHKKLIGEKNINENENSQARFTVDTAAEITMFKSDKDQFHYIPKNKMHCLFGLLVGGGSLQLLGQKGAIDAEAVVVAGFASEMHHVADVHQQLRM